MALNRLLPLPPEPGESLEAWSRRTDPIREAFDDRVEAAVGDLGVPVSQWPDELRHEIETSWLAILDPGAWTGRSALVQVGWREGQLDLDRMHSVLDGNAEVTEVPPMVAPAPA